MTRLRLNIRKAEISALVCCTVLTILAPLGGCSRDPNKLRDKYLGRGEKYYNSGKFQEAVIEFKNAVRTSPRSAEAHYQLGRGHLALRNGVAAFREFTEAVTLEPGKLDAQLQLGKLEISQRQYDKAFSRVSAVVKAQPANADAHAALGMVYGAKRDLANATAELEKAIQQDPKQLQYYTTLAFIYHSFEKLPEAEAVLRQAVVANPKALDARLQLSRYLIGVRKLPEAETESRAAMALDGRAVAPRLLVASILASTNRAAEAEEQLKNLKTIAPDDPDAYQSLAAYYESTGQTDKALAEFRSLLAAKPENMAVKRRLVENLIGLKQMNEAKILNEELLKYDSKDPLGYLARARILMAEGNMEDALLSLQKLVNLAPRFAGGHYLLGVAQDYLKLPKLARNSFAKALELDPKMAPAAAALAVMANAAGDPETALHSSATALEADPQSLPAQVARAGALLAKGDSRASEAIVQDVLKRNPSFVPALTLLLELRARQGKVAEVVQRLEPLSEQAPQSADLHLLLAMAYHATGDQTKAESEMRSALRVNPKIRGGHLALARVYFAQKATEKAKEELRAAIAVEPNEVSSYLVLESQLETERNWAEAIKVCEKARQVDPDSPLVANQLAYLYLEHGGDSTTAMSMALDAKRKAPNSPHLADTLGWAYHKRGMTDKAIEQFKESIRLLPANPTYHYHLGLAYAAAHNPQLARTSLEAALKLPNFQYAAEAREALDKISKLSR